MFWPKSTSDMPASPKPICIFNESELLREINLVREKPVKIEPKLDSFAEMRANELPDGNDATWGHSGFRSRVNGYFDKFSILGENLYFNRNHCDDYTSAVRLWLGSPTHKETLLNSRYDSIGIGYANGNYVTIYGDLR